MEGRGFVPPTILTNFPITSDIIYLIETLSQSHVITVNISAEKNSGFGPRIQFLGSVSCISSLLWLP